MLEALHHLAPLCQRKIGNKILKSGGNMTLVIGNLEKGGLVERVQDARDRRYFEIHLTPRGQNLVSSAFPDHAAKPEKVFAVLDHDEQETMGRPLKKLGRSEAP